MEEKKILEIIQRALSEDLGDGDQTSQAIVSPSQKGRGSIFAKESGVVAGILCAEEVFRQLGDVEWKSEISDGTFVEKGTRVANFQGSLRSILAGERVALNFLMGLSGIASLTHRFVQQASQLGIRILDTRKTTPTLRELEKYAVLMGGGENHRQGLFDQILIKENHILSAGSATKALKMAQENNPKKVKIEIEVENLGEFMEILPMEPDIILLDNMGPLEIKEAVARSAKFPSVELEVSGGISLANLREYLIPGLHRMAIGALTHSAPAMDFSLLIEEVL